MYLYGLSLQYREYVFIYFLIRITHRFIVIVVTNSHIFYQISLPDYSFYHTYIAYMLHLLRDRI